MTQEANAEAMAFVRALNQAWNIGDGEAFLVIENYPAEVGGQRGKG